MDGPPIDDALREIADLLKSAENLRRAMLLPDPDPTSCARHDLDTATRQIGTSEPVRRVLRLVDLWTLLEGEHLRGMGVLLEDASTVFPVFPLLRAVLEHGASVCWILDPEVDSQERAVRAALAELRSHTEIVGVTKRWAGTTTDEYRRAMRQLEATRAALVRDFGEIDVEKSTIHGQKLARPTDVIRHFGSCEGDARQWVGTYDYLCGTATHPSLNAFEFVETDDDGSTHVTLTRSLTVRLARMGIAVFVHSLIHMADYLGWPRDATRRFTERVDEVLGPDPIP